MKDVESYYPDDVEVVPFELVRPLVEKLERENADLKQELGGLRAKIDKVVLLLDAVESDRTLFRQVKEILTEELK
jgi:hypothetical protein